MNSSYSVLNVASFRNGEGAVVNINLMFSSGVDKSARCCSQDGCWAMGLFATKCNFRPASSETECIADKPEISGHFCFKL